MARVMVAHPEPTVAEKIAELLAAEEHCVLHSCSTATALVEAVCAENPDVVFLDSSLVGVGCSSLTELLSRSSAIIVILGENGSSATNRSRHSDAFAVDAAAYLTLADLPAALHDALERLPRGEPVAAGHPQTSHTEFYSRDMDSRTMAAREITADRAAIDHILDIPQNAQTIPDNGDIAPEDPRKAAPSVLIGHPYHLSSRGLSHILTRAGYEVVEQCATADQLLAAAAEYKPDIIIVKAGLFEDQPELVRRLTEPGGNVVVALSESEADRATALSAFHSGARGCLSTDDTPENFLTSLQLLVSGSSVMSPVVSGRNHPPVNCSPERSDNRHLSKRERELVTLVADGAQNKEISERLGISPHTVKAHIANILSKLDLRNRQQLAAYAGQNHVGPDASDSTRMDEQVGEPPERNSSPASVAATQAEISSSHRH